jgi:carbon monoxide dehydrogenase subunit G
MKLENRFTVPVPVEEAWRVLLDVERIAPCMPGATLTSVDGDEFEGKVKVKVGPINLTYGGKARFVSKDDATHVAVIDGSGKETRGTGTAKALITCRLIDKGDTTDVEVDTDLNVTGKPAQFGRGVLADVSGKLMGQFVENLERDVLTTAGGGDTSHAGGPYEQAFESVAPQPATASAPPAPATGPRTIDHPEAEPVDLFEVAGGSVGKRLVPIGVAALVLFIVWRILRRG